MRLLVGLGCCLAAVASPDLASAQEEDSELEEADVPAARASLGLAPGTPQVGALPGGITPAYGSEALDATDWRFDFHGYLSMPLRLGINKRAGNVTGDQYSTVLHAPPVVPEYRDAFTYTGALPEPYVQLNFSYGNSIVTGNVVVVSRTAATAASYFDAPKQSGITDAFLTFDVPDLAQNVRFQAHLGAFTNRYGAPGEYDEGKYGTPIIARTNGVGENLVAQFSFGEVGLELQQAFQGQLDKPPLGLTPDPWNDYADPNLGTSFVHHLHAGLAYQTWAMLGLHYMQAWSQDDRASQGLTPDGKIGILGADLRLTLKRFGHLYLGVSHVDARDARSVGRIVEILNAPGGPGLIRNYLGPDSDGTGKLLTLGFQYDLSVGRLMYGGLYNGHGPDIVLSLFGLQTSVESEDPVYDGVTGRKIGMEASYSLLSWLAASARVDAVQPNTDEGGQSFGVISPRVIFRTDWQARDQVMLQYSRYIYGSDVVVRHGTPPTPDPSLEPDPDVVTLSAIMWW